MQFDVFQNKNPKSQQRVPYLMDIQDELLDSLDTRVVVPLIPEQNSRGFVVGGLMPSLEIKGKFYLAMIPQLAGIARRELGPCVGNISQARAEIIAALDLLFTGV